MKEINIEKLRVKFGMAVMAIGCMTLAACIRGGGGGVPIVPTASVPQLDYSNTVAPRHSYTPYETRSHAHALPLSDAATELHIGGDLEPRENLRHIATRPNGIRWFMGASRDGVGVERLKNYEQDLVTQDGADPDGLSGDGFEPFTVQPSLYLDPDLLASENAGILQALYDSVLILNDALPPEFQIVLVDTRATGIANPGEIVVNLESPAFIQSTCGATTVACARNWPIEGYTQYTESSVLLLPNDLDTSEYMFSRSLIVHELLHALGIQGHVDSIEFPDSIMGSEGEYIPNVGHIISKIDKEVLQIMYMNQRTDLYNDWGEWSDTSFHLVGRTDDGILNFGVALFNGLPQPWVRGTLPNMYLVDNKLLHGTATWSGNLLGFSGSTPIAGDAELQVFLSTLAAPDNEQDLRFRDIFFLNRFESDSPDRWFHTRNIDYKVNVSGNGFLNVRGEGYEQGYITGAFLGPEHEHMGGTVKRTDMVGAFGGTR